MFELTFREESLRAAFAMEVQHSLVDSLDVRQHAFFFLENFQTLLALDDFIGILSSMNAFHVKFKSEVAACDEVALQTFHRFREVIREEML